MRNIDYERLRKDLIDYFGTAMSFMPMAVMDVSRVERASREELIRIANENRFDLDEYRVNSIDEGERI